MTAGCLAWGWFDDHPCATCLRIETKCCSCPQRDNPRYISLPGLPFALVQGPLIDAQEEEFKYNPDWALRTVKYDIRHWMSNVFLMCLTKDSALFKYFCVAISDAVYMIIPSSREEVRAHLKFLGLSDEQIKRVARKYWRSRARFVVPDPATLLRRLWDVYDFFYDLQDPTTGRNFFTVDSHKRWKHEMTYVARGDISDIPGQEMYLKVGEYESGLPRYVTLRSSSALEGYHLHLANVR